VNSQCADPVFGLRYGRQLELLLCASKSNVTQSYINIAVNMRLSLTFY